MKYFFAKYDLIKFKKKKKHIWRRNYFVFNRAFSEENIQR